MWSCEVPGGGAPNFPHSEPSHVSVPSVLAPWMSVVHSRVDPLRLPDATTPQASLATTVFASVVTRVFQNNVVDWIAKRSVVSYAIIFAGPLGTPSCSSNRTTVFPGPMG